MSAKRRVQVAKRQQRLPAGALTQSPDPSAPRRGRAPKDPADRARALSVSVFPDELEAFERYRAELAAELPVGEVSKSDMARLAMALLLRLPPRKAIAELAKLKRESS